MIFIVVNYLEIECASRGDVRLATHLESPLLLLQTEGLQGGREDVLEDTPDPAIVQGAEKPGHLFNVRLSG